VPTLAVIVQNFKRPQNIGLVVRNARAALPDTPIFLLDQADEPGLRQRGDIPWSEVWYQKAAVNRGPARACRSPHPCPSISTSPSTTTSS
jgi:hypothetical protein